MSGVFSIKARPFWGPITVTAVASASASVAFCAMMVTLERPSALFPVLRFMMWECLFPSIIANC